MLQWTIDSEKLRRAAAKGAGNCKVKIESEEGAMHGWVVIDMRSARLNVQRYGHVASPRYQYSGLCRENVGSPT